jgi:HAE1 family hydrophobic/amphiphilic exporter-1
MTSIAFILGVVPLLTSSGAGAASRVSIGITVFSGMIASTCLAVALVPVFFVEIKNMTLKRQAKREQKALVGTKTDQVKE